MGQKLGVLVALWVMALISVVVLDGIGVIDVTIGGDIMGFKIGAAGVAALFVALLVVFVYLLGKIPATRGLAEGFRTMTGI
jgi:hypothetical protein